MASSDKDRKGAGKNPLFFSCSISRLALDFVVDSITGFAREKGAEIKLQELQKEYSSLSFIGFRLNNFREINVNHTLSSPLRISKRARTSAASC